MIGQKATFGPDSLNIGDSPVSRTIVPGVKMLAIPTPVRVPGLSLEAVAGVMTGPDQDKVSRVPVQRRQPRLAP